jgi:hypothetical protein
LCAFYCIGFVSTFSCPPDKYCGYICIGTLPPPSTYSLFMIKFQSRSPSLVNRLLALHIWKFQVHISALKLTIMTVVPQLIIMRDFKLLSRCRRPHLQGQAVPVLLAPEDGTCRLCRNVSEKYLRRLTCQTSDLSGILMRVRYSNTSAFTVQILAPLILDIGT